MVTGAEPAAEGVHVSDHGRGHVGTAVQTHAARQLPDYRPQQQPR